jgi:hypothetical protein
VATTQAAAPARTRHRRPGLAAFSGLVALSAWFGVWGLISGVLDLGAEITQRLPFDSPVLGGLALGTIVALPATVVAVLAARGDERAPDACLVAGVLVVGWIVVQLAFIRELSFFHPTYVAVGLGLVAWGLLAGREVRGR